MRNLKLLFIFQLTSLAFLFSSDKEEIPKIFSFKSGIVEYEVVYSNDSTKLKRTLYIDDYGRKLCMDYRIISNGEKHFIYIFNEKGSIGVNMNMRTAAKRKNPPELFDDEALGDWFKEIIYGKRKREIEGSYNSKGIEEILGKDCKVYESEKEKIWIWENLILKWEKDNRIQKAKSIQIDVSIPPERFEIPKGVWVFPKIF